MRIIGVLWLITLLMSCSSKQPQLELPPLDLDQIIEEFESVDKDLFYDLDIKGRKKGQKFKWFYKHHGDKLIRVPVYPNTTSVMSKGLFGDEVKLLGEAMGAPKDSSEYYVRKFSRSVLADYKKLPSLISLYSDTMSWGRVIMLFPNENQNVIYCEDTALIYSEHLKAYLSRGENKGNYYYYYYYCQVK